MPRLSGYLNACGHFRTGILTSPLTGLLIAEMIGGEPLSFPVEPFLLSRFVSGQRSDARLVALGPPRSGGRLTAA